MIGAAGRFHTLIIKVVDSIGIDKHAIGIVLDMDNISKSEHWLKAS